MHFLDFEQPIAELEAKIDELRSVESKQDVKAVSYTNLTLPTKA